MFLRTLAFFVVTGLFATEASASLAGIYTGISRVGSKPAYVILGVPRFGDADGGPGTGAAIVNGQRIRLTGDTDEGFSGISEDGTIDVEIAIVEGRRRYEVTIILGEGDETVVFRLNRKPTNVPYAGNYTLFAPGNLKQPAPPPPEETGDGTEETEEPAVVKTRPKLLDGHGIGVMVVKRNGLARAALHLADGTHITCGGAFDSLFSLPLAASTASGTTFIGATSFVSNDSSDGSGVFRWTRNRGRGHGVFRPGFDFYQPLAISRYKPDEQPLKTDQGPQGRATLKGGPLTRNAQAPITFGSGKLSAPDFGLASGLNVFSGHFSGEVRLPGLGIPARAAGIVFLKHNRIYGVALTRFGSSALTIEADNEHLKD